MRVFRRFALPALSVAIGCIGAGGAACAETGASPSTTALAWGAAPKHAASFIAVASGTDLRETATSATAVSMASTTASVTPSTATVATKGDADSGDLPHPAALVLAAVAAIGFVGRRLRD